MDFNSVFARAQQRVVQFACMFPTKPELTRKERDALKKFLVEADSELFQLMKDPVASPGVPKPLFLATRQYSVGSLVAEAPSLLFVPESITITQVVRIGSVKTGGDDTLENSILNRKMRDLFVKMQEVVKGLRYSRAGKIFEFNFGPFMPGEKTDLLKGLLVNPGEIVTLQSQLTRLIKRTEDLNVATALQFQQMEPSQPFMLQVKVDINNRNHGRNLELRNIEQVFSDADIVIKEHLEWLFGGAA
jgi:hypothetical protein